MTAEQTETSISKRILVVDDDTTMREVLRDSLREQGYEVSEAGSKPEVETVFQSKTPDLVLLDVFLPGTPGTEILSSLLERNPTLRVIMMSADGTSNTAIRARTRGAIGYLPKPFDLDLLADKVSAALATQESSAVIERLRPKLREQSNLGLLPNLIGNSPAMQEVYRAIGEFASSDLDIVIIGETGTGKKLVAQTIHDESKRARGPFKTVDCGSLTATLLESELFGHEKGSFTGAFRQRKGAFEQVHLGTLFMDEIGNMSKDMQEKVLRAAEGEPFQRVGGNEDIKVDVRIVAATNVNLEELRDSGAFRTDLYYRLAEASILLPPLRERIEDIPTLVAYFLNQAESNISITDAALERLTSYSWPGNIRELRTVIRRATAKAQGRVITAEHLELESKVRPWSLKTSINLTEAVRQRTPLASILDQAEKKAVQQALSQVDGDHSKAAEILGVSTKFIADHLRGLNGDE